MKNPRRRALAVKRALDVVGAVAAGTILAPVIGATALVLRVNIGRPIFFRQNRPGLGGEVFTLCKFRTMNDARASDGGLLSDEERLTSFGSWLRRWSLDELPELWNVLKGDMSLVGPRPLLVDYLDLYSDEQMRRHEMRPGLTGLAQVIGRNDQSWEDRLALDVWYIDHWSLCLDIRILVSTVFVVFSGHGISARNHATMPTFGGGGSSSVALQPAFGWRSRRDGDARRLTSSVFHCSGPRSRTSHGSRGDSWGPIG